MLMIKKKNNPTRKCRTLKPFLLYTITCVHAFYLLVNCVECVLHSRSHCSFVRVCYNAINIHRPVGSHSLFYVQCAFIAVIIAASHFRLSIILQLRAVYCVCVLLLLFLCLVFRCIIFFGAFVIFWFFFSFILSLLDNRNINCSETERKLLENRLAAFCVSHSLCLVCHLLIFRLFLSSIMHVCGVAKSTVIYKYTQPKSLAHTHFDFRFGRVLHILELYLHELTNEKP